MKKNILKLFLLVIVIYMVLLLMPATNVSALCIPYCVPFMPCGAPDGCGGKCPIGMCPPGQECISYTCQQEVCIPDCAGKPCGASDGCVGVCQEGFCDSNHVCISGICQLPPPVCGDGIVEGDEECDSTINCGGDCNCFEGYMPNAGYCLPAYTCSGFYAPFDVTLQLKGKVNRAIPLKIELFHMDTLVTDADISAPPVVNIKYYAGASSEGIDATDQLEPLGNANEGNAFRFDLMSGYWIYNLGTKQYSAAGTYEIKVSPGNTNYFIVDPGCFGYFIRLL